MHLSYIPQYTIQNRNVDISVLNGALWDMEQVHHGICEWGHLLWVIYVREDNYSNVQVMIKRLIWTIWTPMSSVLKKADKLNLSLSLADG